MTNSNPGKLFRLTVVLLLLTLNFGIALVFSGLTSFGEQFPFWVTGIATCFLTLSSIYIGYIVCIYQSQTHSPANEGSVNTVVGAILALLAFLLAFTFSVTTERFDTRKNLLLEDVHAIEKLYLRAYLIPRPEQDTVKMLLKKYVALRVEVFKHPENFAELYAETEAIHLALWKLAEQLSVQNLKNPDLVSVFVDAVSELNEMAIKRKTVSLVYHLPAVIWFSLFVLTIISMMGIGYLFGMQRHANWIICLLLSISYSSIILLIADLDTTHPGRNGIIRVNQTPMIELMDRLERTP